jgi:hypothetical protein
MFKREAEESSCKSAKKRCMKFKTEWLTECSVVTDLPHGTGQHVLLGEVFEYSETDDMVFCKFCVKARCTNEWTTGKSWSDWKVDHFKRHLTQKYHTEAITKLRNQSRGLLKTILTESVQEREIRKEFAQRKQATPDEVKVLIDNVLLAVKINSSMLSVQDIHDHVAKYVKIPESWRSKNYAFEFINCINSTIKTGILKEIKQSAYHTLIVDESTDISVSKMLILYMKFRNESESNHKTVFAGIIKITSCDSASILGAIRKFYLENELNLNQMVMFTSDGASVMLGKRNGVAALLRQSIPHLSEQHCVAHREDLGIDDAWRCIPLMKELETLFRTVYTIFSRSSVKKAKFEEFANTAEADAISFRPLNEVRWLSRHFAVNALVKNYDILVEYLRQVVEEDNDPVHKYCLQKLENPEYHVAIVILNEILAELADLCKILQRSVLSTVEAFQFAKAKVMKLRSQYLGDKPHFHKSTLDLLSSYHSPVKTDSIIMFIQQTCDHMDHRFPDDELKDWLVFDKDCFTASANLDNYSFGFEQIKRLAEKYCGLLRKDGKSLQADLCNQYPEFKIMIKEKLQMGAVTTFSDIVSFTAQQDQFKELFSLLDICGTFQASSADCERGFSLMNNIKTKSRNRLEVEHLDNLMRIKFFLNSGQMVDIDAVYDLWKTEKNRRETVFKAD